MATLTATQILTAGRIIAKLKAPYFRAMLMSFESRPAPGLGTVGVTRRGILFYDPAFVETLTPEQMGGLWLHECLHRVHRHAERQGTRDPKLYNQAGDLAINPAVLDMGAVLPDGDNAGLYPDKFGWKRGLTADEYYELLRKLAEQQRPQASALGVLGGPGPDDEGNEEQDGDGEGAEASGDGGGGGKDADHDHDGGGDPKQGQQGDDGQQQGGSGSGDKPHAAGGWCGSCAGRPIPGEPEDRGGGQGDGKTDAQLERISRQVAEDIKAHASKSRGSIPESLRRWADGFLQPPKIPWQTKLARLVRSAVAYRPGAVDHRWDGPGRRQAGLGYGPGRPVMPRLRAPVPRVAVAVDTSGSMGQAEMVDALRETRGVLAAVGAEVDFVSCDARVHGLGRIKRIEDVAPLLKGGGGTDFRPVFEELAKRRPRPEVVIFVTDGQGPAPEHQPGWARTVWVLVGPYRESPCDWGEHIEVESEKDCKTD